MIRSELEGADGTGRRLCRALLDATVADGYQVMPLDIGVHNDEAVRTFESLGFRERPPYHDYPADLLVNLRFMEKSLIG